MKEMMDLLFKIPFEQRAKPKSPKNPDPSYSTTTLVSTTLGDTTTTWEYIFSTLTTTTTGWLDDTTTTSTETSTESTTRSMEKIVGGTSEKIERWDRWNQVIKEIFPGMAHWTIYGISMSFYVNVCHFCRFYTHVIKCLYMSFEYPFKCPFKCPQRSSNV